MADDKKGREPADVNATRSSRAPILELPRSVIANSVSLTFPAQLTEKDWQEVGQALGRAGGTLQWWIGDWWAYSEHRYGDRKATVEGDAWSGPSFQACMDCAAVARAFETSRRREVLTFTHHREVTSLPPAEADLLLDEAEADGLTIRALRERVKQVKAYLASEGEKSTGAAVRSTIAAARHGLARRSLGPDEIPSQPVPVYTPIPYEPPRVVQEVEYVSGEAESPAERRLRQTASDLKFHLRAAADLFRRQGIGAAVAKLSGEERDQASQDVEDITRGKAILDATANVIAFPK